ncbi:hypothetical protein BVY04_05145 [bacterium M21]|nr:hypothetical protein BVY04_05145 [bacterium M21]
MNRTRAQELTARFAEQRVAVVGDLMLDRYIWGSARRISPEAPVPVVEVKKRRAVLGGAANVLRNLASFGAHAIAFGIIGADPYGEEFCALCSEWGIDTSFIFRQPDRQTTIKTRVIADNQQVVRVDDECAEFIGQKVAEQILSSLKAAVEEGRIDAIILEDYNKGVMTRYLAQSVQVLAEEHNLPCMLDPHPGNTLNVTGLTLMTPNRPEAFALAGAYYRDTVLPIQKDLPLLDVAEKVRADWQPKNLLITLGSGGMALFDTDDKCYHIPTVAQEVFDVSGAGDTVIATWTAALLAGATPAEACEISNHAAGIVVGKVGTVCIEVPELLASF